MVQANGIKLKCSYLDCVGSHNLIRGDVVQLIYKDDRNVNSIDSLGILKILIGTPGKERM